MKLAWGKTDQETNAIHLLVHHSADVAAVFSELIKCPSIKAAAERAAGQPLSSSKIDALTVFAFLHDIGKIAPAFQRKGWPNADQSQTMGHLECGLHWLRQLEETSLGGRLPALATMAGDDAIVWFHAVFSHHGKPPCPADEARGRAAFKPTTGYDWRAQEAHFAEALAMWFPGFFNWRLPSAKPELVHFVCGILSLADWIGSDRTGFSFVSEFDPYYWVRAQCRASKVLKKVGLNLSPENLAGPPNWDLISDFPHPRSAQAALAKLPADERLVILEAETGAGKTEAALWHFARLLAAGNIEAMYFAVPTRAAARQLHTRINTALSRMLCKSEEAILAIPGQIKAGDATGYRLPDFSVRWDDDATQGRWAAEHATRFLAARVAVGTVDQAMLSALQVKHAHMRSSILSRALLVVDEVHASDVWMTRIQKAMLDTHLALGGSALLMSATLGAAARCLWTGVELPDPEAAASIPYPAVWAGSRMHQVDQDKLSVKAVAMCRHSGWDAQSAAQLAISAARDGARVLLVRNTVERARETWTECDSQEPNLVMALNGRPCLHHSRFAAEDRAALDARVEQLLGKGSPVVGVIVIGTQTLEQSLDISADLLITDLCPMDVLLQRIGRLHRHSNVPHPEGFTEPRCIVLTPENGLDALTRRAENGLGVFEDAASISGVYLDVCGLQATLDQIDRHSIWHIPTMNRALVEAATHPSNLEEIARRKDWENHRARVSGKAFADNMAANHVLLDRSRELSPFPEDEAIRTRIGEAGVVLQFSDRPTGPFDIPIGQLAMPARWSHGLDPNELSHSTTSTGLRIQVSGRKFLYDASGLHKET